MEAFERNEVDVFVSMGGNFSLACSDTETLEAGMQRIGARRGVMHAEMLLHGLSGCGRRRPHRRASGDGNAMNAKGRLRLRRFPCQTGSRLAGNS